VARASTYFAIVNENASYICGIDPIFTDWMQELLGMEASEIIQCTKEIGNLKINFAAKYPSLSNMQIFESRLLT